MPRFPAYGPHFQYYNSYNYRPHTSLPESFPISNPSIPKKSPKAEELHTQKSKHDTPVWFDLFGIKLYFDDVLILSLLFFLYKEEVKDEGLFLALILLLIS